MRSQQNKLTKNKNAFILIMKTKKKMTALRMGKREIEIFSLRAGLPAIIKMATNETPEIFYEVALKEAMRATGLPANRIEG